MPHPKNISIAYYTYQLPVERIAAFPLAERDASRLLIYKEGAITEDVYRNIAGHLPENSLLVFNDTKVIPARILFQKPSGGIIEIFCLEPYEAINEYSSIMNKKGAIQWKCMIGGAGKWKQGPLSKQLTIGAQPVTLDAKLVEKLPDAYVVEFSWQPAGYSFSEVIEHAGDIPLPPYIKRTPEATDRERYQTIYARQDGSVAAPTAGLHFTENVFASLAEKKIAVDYVTLHVGAGTFKPVKAATMEDHEMHAEWIEVSAAFIERLIQQLPHTIVATGTTSLRTLETLYWMGVKAMLFPACKWEELEIQQWDVYEAPLATTTISSTEALRALHDWLVKNRLTKMLIQTKILIAPGYVFRIARVLITNFHQPQSTLLLLVAAAIGHGWRKVYDHALENGFRFLSYGDGSVLFIDG